MKISLITTLPGLAENSRIETEVKALGHEFSLLDLKDFNFVIQSGKVVIPEIDKLDSDIVIIRGIFNSIKTISVIMSDLRNRGVRVFDNNFLEHLYSIDKVTDLVKLSIAGIAVPKTAYVLDFKEYPRKAEKLGYPLIVKSTRMGKGASVFKIDTLEKLKRFISAAKKQGKKAKNFILQEFVDYRYDLRVLIIGEDIFVMRRIPKQGEFRANFSLGGSVELFDLDEDGKKLALEALGAVGMSVGGVDILITDEGKKYVLEVNHTAGFVGMERATGKNIGRMFVEHAIASAI